MRRPSKVRLDLAEQLLSDAVAAYIEAQKRTGCLRDYFDGQAAAYFLAANRAAGWPHEWPDFTVWIRWLEAAFGVSQQKAA